MSQELQTYPSDPTTAWLGAPSLWRDEDPAQFDQLMEALNAELAPPRRTSGSWCGTSPTCNGTTSVTAGCATHG